LHPKLPVSVLYSDFRSPREIVVALLAVKVSRTAIPKNKNEVFMEPLSLRDATKTLKCKQDSKRSSLTGSGGGGGRGTRKIKWTISSGECEL